MIIGLTGFKGTGKTVASKYLQEKYGFAPHNFKDELIAEIKRGFPDLLNILSRDSGMSIDEMFIKKPETLRALMQNYGTDVRREDNPDYWVSKWEERLAQLPDNIVTDDVRFLNEAKAVFDRNGIIVRVTRPDVTSGGSHQSETEQLEIESDFIIEGQPGSHISIYNQIDSIIETIKRD